MLRYICHKPFVQLLQNYKISVNMIINMIYWPYSSFVAHKTSNRCVWCNRCGCDLDHGVGEGGGWWCSEFGRDESWTYWGTRDLRMGIESSSGAVIVYHVTPPTSRTHWSCVLPSHSPDGGTAAQTPPVNCLSASLCVKFAHKGILRWMIPANTRRWVDAGLMLGQRRRRWANLKSALAQRHVFFCTKRRPRDIYIDIFFFFHTIYS